MSDKSPNFNRSRFNPVLEKARKSGGLTEALAEYVHSPYESGVRQVFWTELGESLGVWPSEASSLKQFWCRDLQKAVAALTDKAYAKRVRGILELRLEGQFSTSWFRRSYRSCQLSYYTSSLIELIEDLIRLYYMDENLYEILSMNNDWTSGFDYALGYELRQGTPEFVDALIEAMNGDNSRFILTRRMTDAVIISGNPQLLDQLEKLLLAAQLQEGLRQQILEAADKGSVDILARLMRLCLQHDLFRFSSAARAMGTWAGLGEAVLTPDGARRVASLGLTYLDNENQLKKALDSENNLEAYMALWAQGCREIADTDAYATKLLTDSRKYRQVLGWYFVTHTDSSALRMTIASRHLAERDEELLAWIIANLSQTNNLIYPHYNTDEAGRFNSAFPKDLEMRRGLFRQLKEVALFIGNKQRKFEGNPFNWVEVTLENDPVIKCLMSVAGYDMDPQMVDELTELVPFMDADRRQSLIKFFLKPEQNPLHRETLQKMLDDRSVYVKERAIDKLAKCQLITSEIDKLTGGLRSKSSDVRQAIIKVLENQPADQLSYAVQKLLASKKEYEVQGGIDILNDLKDQQPELLEANRPAVEALRKRKLSTQTEILLDQLLPAETTEEVWGPENGFGLFSSETVAVFTQNLTSQPAAPIPDVTPLAKDEITALIPTQEEFDALIDRMDAVFTRHANYEYEVDLWDGSHEKRLFGDATHSMPIPMGLGFRRLNEPEAKLEKLPFWDEFAEALGSFATDIDRMLGLYLSLVHHGRRLYGTVSTDAWWEKITQGLEAGLSYPGQSRRRFWAIIDILEFLPKLFNPHQVFVRSLCFYQGILAVIGEENLGRTCMWWGKTGASTSRDGTLEVIDHRLGCLCRSLFQQVPLNDQDFCQWFLYEYRLEGLVEFRPYLSLGMNDYFRACDLGIISQEVLYAFLCDLRSSRNRNDMAFLTHPLRFRGGTHVIDGYPWAKNLVDNLIEHLVTVEEKRGELPTPITDHCNSIKRFYGARHFCALLAALGKESFFRGYDFSSHTTKKAVLSRLLKRCFPAPEDTAESLKALLKATDIKDSRLAEAAMYAPQWARFAEEILDWPGLHCGIWFFHAHINENFSAEKETEVALYSPITPNEFNDGTFDKNWFLQAYGQLGEKRFNVLYKSAKYITTGSNQHRRSQLYTDAVLGKLDADALRAEIVEKRNQERLRCWPLIPLNPEDPADALRRYEFIQQFRKESRQFGAQRQASEKLACDIALRNLAITTGLMDVTRLTWQMESSKMDELRPLMEPATVDGVTLRLAIDEAGDASVLVEKDGKTLKTAPKSLAKHEHLLLLKASAKDLKEQKRRGRESLETAMCESTEFTCGEIVGILRNPVLSPLVEKLLWIADGSEASAAVIGFPHAAACEGTASPSGLELVDLNGEPMGVCGNVRVAHPHDLREAGVWADYMHLLYQEKLMQPFKQVFREYYPITEDELQERTISRRYAGHQVETRRTVALLKKRGWTVDYEEGLQKVFYKENILVRMYALADWFTPADIEAPTLETVEFFDRGTKKNVPLEDVPAILFSEVMRDLDLVVSVAHVGGVDPEASHSTVEMRLAIAAELVKLLKLANVSWVGNHAKIQGSLANYSVHMGSGIVHAEGKGMVAIVPVHSQIRGRIFLPFADNDPKTAEIMSKIVLLAEDKKIKDPAILRQIR